MYKRVRYIILILLLCSPVAFGYSQDTGSQDSEFLEYRRPIALKTNMLYDIMKIFNAEIEVPVSDKMSITADITFPWWLNDNRQRAFQINALDIEGRYWFRQNRSLQDKTLNNHNPLTGLFAGIYGGAGYYDLERSRKGYQGEYFVAGLSAGYVIPQTRNINLELSLNLGYMRSKYREYEAIQDAAEEWNLFKQNEGKFSWFGPTKLKIAVVWYPQFKKRRNSL